MPDYLLLGAIGFLAELVDGVLGMAFGVIRPPRCCRWACRRRRRARSCTRRSSSPPARRRLLTWGTATSIGGCAGSASRASPARCWRVGAVEPRCERRAAVHRRLSAAGRHLHPAQGVALRRRATRPRRGSARSGSWRAFSTPAEEAAGDRSRRHRWSARSRAAHGGRLGQHHRVLRHGRGRHDLLRRARCLAMARAARAGDRAACWRRRSAVSW